MEPWVHKSLSSTAILSKTSTIHTHFLKIRINGIPHLRLDLPSVLFPSRFSTKSVNEDLISSTRATSTVHLITLDLTNPITLVEDYKLSTLSQRTFILSPHLDRSRGLRWLPFCFAFGRSRVQTSARWAAILTYFVVFLSPSKEMPG
jgi:hypothetical protein